LKANKDLDNGGPKCWCCRLIGVVVVLINVLMAPRIVKLFRLQVVNKRSRTGLAITPFCLSP
jgi:hypothetical protein